MPKLDDHERPDGASLAFLRHFDHRYDREGRFHDCLSLVSVRRRETVEEQLVVITERWGFTDPLNEGRLAVAYPADLRALLLLCRWYKGLTKQGRALAYAEIWGELRAIPNRSDPWARAS